MEQVSPLAWEVLGDGPFRLAGSPTCVATNDEYVCVGGSLGSAQWGWTRDARRGNLEGNGHRVTVFRRGGFEPLWLLRVPLEVRAVEIDASGRFAVVAAGEYDGGWMYKGALSALDLETGAMGPIIRADREYSSLRWTDESDLEFVVSPFGDEDEHPFRRMVLTKPDISALLASPADLPQEGEPLAHPDGATDDRQRTSAAARATLAALSHGEYRVRTCVWDLAVDEVGAISACLTNVAAEHWVAAGRLSFSATTEAQGGQIVDREDEVIAWSAAHPELTDFGIWTHRAPRLASYDKRSGVARPIASHPLGGPGLLTTRKDGALLLRPALDRVHTGELSYGSLLLPGAHSYKTVPLPWYMLGNHHMIVRGATDLLIVIGAQDDPKANLWIARVNDDASVERLYPVEWDSTRSQGMLPDFGVMWAAGDKPMLIHTGATWIAREQRAEYFLVSRDYKTGEVTWCIPLDGAPTGIAVVGHEVVVSSATGDLIAVDAGSGVESWREPITIAGERATPLSLAGGGAWIAVGLMDGRILRRRVD